MWVRDRKNQTKFSNNFNASIDHKQAYIHKEQDNHSISNKGFFHTYSSEPMYAEVGVNN